jgi:hypothetical protein
MRQAAHDYAALGITEIAHRLRMAGLDQAQWPAEEPRVSSSAGEAAQ